MKKIFAAGVIMSILSVLLSLCARKVTGFAQAYSVTIYPVLKGIFARIFGIFPFSVSEVGLYLLLLLCIFSVVKWFKTPVAFRAKCKMFSRHLQKPILKTEKGRFKGL